jgi:putative peptide zinc metalloprotease protein
VNEIAFQTALIASVSSVAANLNPLIKLDAYYGLSDAVGIPNLREHSFRYLRTMVPHFLFGRQVAVPGLSARRRRIFLAYGLLAGAYSLTLLILFARHAFEFLVNRSGDWGVVAFLALAFFMIRPAAGGRRRAVGEAGGIRSVRRLAGTFVGLPPTAYRLAAAFLVLAGLAMIPRWAMPVRLRCVFAPARQAVLYAPEDAQVVDVLFTEGQRVEAGQPLLVLRATELHAELTRARLQLAFRRLREQEAQLAGDLAGWRAEERQADAQRSEIDQLERRANGLTVSSPLAGVCLTPRPRDLLGRTLTRGAPLVAVGDTTRLLAVAHVEPDATGDVGPGAPAQAMPYSLPGTVLRGRVRELSQATVALPAGGSARSGFRLTVPVANPGALRPGMSGSLKVYGPSRSLLGHLYWAALRLVRADLWG